MPETWTINDTFTNYLKLFFTYKSNFADITNIKAK